MSVAISCPRCGGPVRPPDLMVSSWRCDEDGPIAPLHVPERVSHDVTTRISTHVGDGRHHVPLWCPWPLPVGWLVTGLGWAGDDRTGTYATAVACSGPAPLSGGPADVILVAEEPGVGLGNRFAGIPGPDPGRTFADMVTTTAHAKIKAGGHDTPMWLVGTSSDRVAYVGEALGRWLYAIAWPDDAGYILSEHIVLHDLTDWVPAELVYGAPSPYLRSGV